MSTATASSFLNAGMAGGWSAWLIMADMCDHFREFIVEGTELNRAKLKENIDRSVMMVTALPRSSAMTRPRPSPTTPSTTT